MRHSIVFSLIFAILAGPNPCCCTWDAIFSSWTSPAASTDPGWMASAESEGNADVALASTTPSRRSCCQAKFSARQADVDSARGTAPTPARSCCSKPKPTANHPARSADGCTRTRSAESQWSHEDCGCSIATAPAPAIVPLRDASSETKSILQGAAAILEPLPVLSAGRLVSRDTLREPSRSVASRRALLQRWNC